MMGRPLAVLLWLVFAAGNAEAFRDDLPQDFERDCRGEAVTLSLAYRQECALRALERACARDPATTPEAIAEVLQVKPLQVLKAMGRHTLASLEQGGLCERNEGERRFVLAASMQAKKAPSEAAQEWLLKELAGATGEIDHQAVARALEQRAAILAASQEKRAGLPASPAGWTNLTGYTQSPGRINHILFTSGTGNDILLGSDGGGIWRSTNGGSTWTAISDFLGSLAIANLARAGNDANTIYAATNPRGSHTYFPFGVIKSTDGGTTWSQVAATNPASNADFTYVQRIAVHPTNSSIVLAATNSGAYETTNGGTTWTKIGGVTTRAYFVAFHPTDGNRRAVGYDDGTVRFTTTGDLLGAGATTSTVLAGGRYTKVAYAKSDTSVLYALVTDGTTSATRIFKSTSAGGAPWTEISNAGLNSNGTFYNSGYLRYTGALWVDPLNANRVAVAEGWASFTADISVVSPTWKRLVSGWTDFHGIVEHPAYDGAANKTVFFMDDGGLYRVTDVDILDTNPSPFTQFTRIELGGLTVTQVYSVSGHGGNPIFGAQDTGPKVYRTDPATGDATNKWRLTRRPVGDPLCPSGCNWIGDGMTTAASTANPSVLYGSRQYLDMFRSTDGGLTSSSIVYGSALTEGGGATSSNQNAAFLAPFVLDPSNQSRMLAGGNSLWRSNNVDSGSPPTWTSIRDPYTESACGSVQPVATIAIAPSNSDVVWIAYQCAGRLFKTANATASPPTWTEVTTLPALANLRSKTSITFDRANPNIVWIGLGNYQTSTLFRTTDGGATAGGWSTISGLPGAPVYALLQHPASDSWLYAATGVGLFASEDGGANWSTSNEGPANVVVRSIDWNGGGTTPELLAGTFGRGVFKATVSFAALSASTTTLVAAPPSPVVTGTSVTFTATVAGSSGTPTGSVVFRDGGVDIATVSLNGSAQASLTTSSLSVGSHSITANYQGNGTYSSSSSSAVVFNILASSATALSAIPASVVAAGSPATFTATVSGSSGTPTGSVIFRDGAVTLATVTLNGGGQAVFTTSSLAVGSHSITASYQGSSTYAASSSPVVNYSVVAKSQSTTTLAAAPPSPSLSGTSVSFTATVSGGAGTPTGSVIFQDGLGIGAFTIATVSLNGAGQAVFTTSAFSVGTHTIVAYYQGDATYVQSSSSTVVYNVIAPSTTTLAASPVSSATSGASVTFTATVGGSSGVPTGSVTFTDGAVELGTIALNGSAQAALTTSALAVGNHSITASYAGSATYAASSSAALPYTITSGNPARLFNISTRMQVLTGNDVMIAGFIVGGSTSKRVVVNVAGPSLAQNGIANPLANPTLTLVRSADGAVIGSNDNWQTQTNAGDVAAIQASGFQPNNALEPAIIATLAPGAYTAIVSGVGGGTGVGLVGLFEVDHPEVPLINISTRGKVLTGNDVMIAGFIIQGTGTQTVVVNVAGPSLAQNGIANPLANPTLTLVRSADGAVMGTNDNWQSQANAGDVAAIQASGFAPNNALEPALIATLAPGAYTAIVSGVGGGTGVGLVGVFVVP